MKETEKPMSVQAAMLVKRYKNRPADAAYMLVEVYDGTYPEAPEKIQCKRGCSWCCNSRVQVTRTEAKMMEKFIRLNKSEIERFGIMKRTKSNMAKIKNLSFEEKIKVRMPCPLLVNGACSIYKARPLMCRSAYSSDAELCELAHKNPDKEVPVPLATGPRNFAGELITGILVAENNNNESKTFKFIEEWLTKLFKK